jgi:SAM-dependent methyltransferase
MSALRQIIEAARRLGGKTRSPGPQSAPTPVGETVSFRCNVCGGYNHAALLAHVENRECQSCMRCKSSLRMRSLMYLLSLELFGKPLLLQDFPSDKSVRGLGMSDWDGYAVALSRKLGYVNTYYHTEPKLDITDIAAHEIGKYDFIISSDVFEHIPGFHLDMAFQNCRRLLNERGFFLFTVPFMKHGETKEHFPRLHDFRIVERNGARTLLNRTADGTDEVFEDLVFHGGDGMTLEMRVFAESDLRRRLEQAGFSSVKVCSDHYPEFGILWPTDFDVPIIARA